jgi:hypothetical protein
VDLTTTNVDVERTIPAAEDIRCIKGAPGLRDFGMALSGE